MDNSEKYYAVPDAADNVAYLVEQMFEQQKREWPLAAKNFEGLKSVQSREIDIKDRKIIVQFNPERIRSSAAKVDAKSLSERKCFLCLANIPAEQKCIPVCGNFLILINPFPIFEKHLTIPNVAHINQRIEYNAGIMLDLAAMLTDYVVFYNGPKCGASAPDHMHFQAGNKGFMPVEKEFAAEKNTLPKIKYKSVDVYFSPNYMRRMITLQSNARAEMTEMFEIIYKFLAVTQPNEDEPMLNVLCYADSEKWTMHIFPRIKQRPTQFFEQGEKQLLVSPASVELGGLLITPRAEDFEKIKAEDIEDIYNQITMPASDFDKLTEALKKLQS